MFLYITAIFLFFVVWISLLNGLSLNELIKLKKEQIKREQVKPLSNFVLTKRLLQKLYTGEFENIDVRGTPYLANWYRVITLGFEKDDYSHIQIIVHYDSFTQDKQTHSILRDVKVDYIRETEHGDTIQLLLETEFVKYENFYNYVCLRKPYKFVEFIDKHFQEFERKRKQLEDLRYEEEERKAAEETRRELSYLI